MKKLLLLLLFAVGAAASLQSCATAKGAMAGAAIGGLAGDASRGAQIGATAGFVVDLFD